MKTTHRYYDGFALVNGPADRLHPGDQCARMQRLRGRAPGEEKNLPTFQKIMPEDREGKITHFDSSPTSFGQSMDSWLMGIGRLAHRSDGAAVPARLAQCLSSF